jgi:pimeloyl-ACP methyl ester carboxylesterase
MAQTDENRIHRAISNDGIEIAGIAHGQGPPLVLVHGSLDDGGVHWTSTLPFLQERFTCYIMCWRNRGHSGVTDDLSAERHVQDVVAFAASINNPVGLVGFSKGAAFVLGAATRLDTLTGVAVYDPFIVELICEDDLGRFLKTNERMAELASQGKLAEASRTFHELVTTEDEITALATAGTFEITGRNVPVDLEFFLQDAEDEVPQGTTPSALAQIKVPLLLMHGSKSRQWFTDSVRYISQHTSKSVIREISGTSHFAPCTKPDVVADELMHFFG